MRQIRSDVLYVHCHAVSQFDESFAAFSEQLEEIESLFSDFNRDLAGYVSELDFSEETFQSVEERLNLINHLKAKYGKTIERILQEKQTKEEKLDQLQHYEEYRSELEGTLKKQRSCITALL